MHRTDLRPLQDLRASSIGLGTYLGDANDETDASYAEAIRTALTLGCNVLDSAISYRCQRSERTIGRVLERMTAEAAVSREDVIVCTKGGYLAFDGSVPPDPTRYVLETVINAGFAPYDEIVAACHCLSPAYLDHALTTSLANLRLKTIDVYYLHNPEQQLDEIDRDAFMRRMEGAFTLLEDRVRQGRVRYYGAATWNGFRVAPSVKNYLSLEALVELAERVGGTGHHFRAIQLPYNLAMPEALVFKNQMVAGELLTPLEAAKRLGMSVVVSATLLQSRLARLPQGISARFPGPQTDAQRAIQFVRSTPGVTTALIGMKRAAHVEENLALAAQPLLPEAGILGLFERAPA